MKKSTLGALLLLPLGIAGVVFYDAGVPEEHAESVGARPSTTSTKPDRDSESPSSPRAVTPPAREKATAVVAEAIRAREAPVAAELKSLFSDTPAGQMMVDHVIAMNGSQAEYEKSLETIRSHPRAAVKELSGAYSRLPEEAYLPRWMMVQALTKLPTGDAVAPLAEIARSEPADASELVEQARDEETRIRMTAINGLGALASQDHRDAEAALLDLIQNGPDDTRLMSVHAYIASGRDTAEREREVAQLLSEEDQWMTSSRVDSVRDQPPTPPPSIQGDGIVPKGASVDNEAG